MQHLGPGAVAEANMLEADVALELREVDCAFPVADLGLLVHHVHDLVQRGDGSQERVVELGELLDRVEEVRQVEQECQQRPFRDRALEVEVAAVAQHHGGRGGREEVDEREVEAVRDDGLLVGGAVVGVDLAEALLVGALARVRLHDAHPGDVLRERRGHVAEPLADGAVRARRVDPEGGRRGQHQRHDREGRQRELPVEQEEDHGRPDEDQRALHEGRDAVRHQLVERVDVVRQPADDHARAVALVVAEREALQMPEEPVAQVGEDALARPTGEVRLRGAREQARDARDGEDRDDPGQRREVLRRDSVVEGQLGEVRRREPDHGCGEERRESQRRAPLVRRRQPRERAHPPNRPPPGPVVDGHVARSCEVATGLPDPHSPQPSSLCSRAGTGCPPLPPTDNANREIRTKPCRLRAECVPPASLCAARHARASTRSANSRSSSPCS